MRSLDGFVVRDDFWPADEAADDSFSDFGLAFDGWSECPDFVDRDFIGPDFVDSEGPAVSPEDLLSRGTP